MSFDRAKNLGTMSKKGNIPWNLGISRTKEEKLKMSVARKEWLSTHNHPKGMLGKKHSIDTIEKIKKSGVNASWREKAIANFLDMCEKKRVLYQCPGCNSVEMLSKSRAKNKKFCSYKCSNKYAIKKRGNTYQGFVEMPSCLDCGKKLVNRHSITGRCRRCWGPFKTMSNFDRKNPINDLIRGLDFYKKWRQECFLRDKFTCQNCGQDSSLVKLQLHHKTTLSELIYKNNIKTINDAINCRNLWNKENAITLCITCHKKTDTYLSGNGKYLTDESRKRISDAQSGHIPWNKGKGVTSPICPKCGGKKAYIAKTCQKCMTRVAWNYKGVCICSKCGGKKTRVGSQCWDCRLKEKTHTNYLKHA